MSQQLYAPTWLLEESDQMLRDGLTVDDIDDYCAAGMRHYTLYERDIIRKRMEYKTGQQRDNNQEEQS
jgi:hypothetical protein